MHWHNNYCETVMPSLCGVLVAFLNGAEIEQMYAFIGLEI